MYTAHFQQGGCLEAETLHELKHTIVDHYEERGALTIDSITRIDDDNGDSLADGNFVRNFEKECDAIFVPTYRYDPDRKFDEER